MQVLKDNFKVLAPEASKMGFQCVTLQKASDNFVTGLIFRYCLAVIPFDYCPVDSTLFWYIISGIFWDFFLFAAYPVDFYFHNTGPAEGLFNRIVKTCHIRERIFLAYEPERMYFFRIVIDDGSLPVQNRALISGGKVLGDCLNAVRAYEAYAGLLFDTVKLCA